MDRETIKQLKENGNILLKHADVINRAVVNWKSGNDDIINPDNGLLLNKNATFNLMEIEKGYENELWTDLIEITPLLGYHTPLLNVIDTDTSIQANGNDTLHVPVLAEDTVVSTLQGSSPSNSDNVTTPTVVDIETKNQINSRFSFTTQQLKSVSFQLLMKKFELQKIAIGKEIQNQLQIVMLEGLNGANRQERLAGNAMTKEFLETARDSVLNNGGDPMNMFCIHDPNTMSKISNIAETTSGNLLYSRFDTSQSNWLKQGVLGDLLGMNNMVTKLANINDAWDGREATYYGSLYFDKDAVRAGINPEMDVLELPVLGNPGRAYNIQAFWGCGLVDDLRVAGIKMYKA